MKRFGLAVLLSASMIAGWASGTSFAADAGAGKAIVEQQCRGCHGMDGKATAPGIPNLAGQPERYLVAALNEYRQGQRIHAALKKMAEQLSAADEQNVAAYYAGLPPVAGTPGAPAAAFSPYEHGKQLARDCTRCHGENGNSTTPGIPSLSAQQPGYFVAAVQEYLTGARETSPMHSLIRDLKGTDLESLALYFASQTPVQSSAPPIGDAAAGERLTGLCSGCHGYHGVSTDSATPSLAGQEPRYLVDAINAYHAGRKHAAMQRAIAVAVKTDKDSENIAAFYAAQARAPVEHGEVLVRDIADRCNRCHSPAVANPALVTPNIRGQDKDYLVMALRAYREGRRESSMMHNMTLPYGNAIIEGVASHYAAQPPR